MVGAALLVAQAYMVADLVCDALEGRNRIMDIDLSTSSAHDLRHLGVRANYRNRGEVFALKWKNMLFVPEQDASLCRCFPNQRAMFGQIGVLLWHFLRMLEEARFDQQLQQATHAHIKRRFLNFAPLDGFEQFLTPPFGRRHLQIEPGIH